MNPWGLRARRALRRLRRRLGFAPPLPDARERAAEAKRRAAPSGFPAPPEPEEATPTQRLPLRPEDLDPADRDTVRLPPRPGDRRRR